MDFQKQPVRAGGHGREGDGFDHFGVAPGDAFGLIGFLHAMGAVHHHGHADFLHAGDAGGVDDQVVVPEGGAPFADPHLVVAHRSDFFHGEAHGFGAEALAFFDV